MAPIAVVDPASLSIARVLLEAAPDSDLAQAGIDEDAGTHDIVLHCEISSAQGNVAAVASTVGAIAGLVVAAVLCAALAWTIIGCLLAILIGVIVGYLVGSYAGRGIGAIADAIDDFDHAVASVHQGECFVFSGRWVMDTEHEHNEIHDIESAVLLDPSLGLRCEVSAAATGIGRLASLAARG